MNFTQESCSGLLYNYETWSRSFPLEKVAPNIFASLKADKNTFAPTKAAPDSFATMNTGQDAFALEKIAPDSFVTINAAQNPFNYNGNFFNEIEKNSFCEILSYILSSRTFETFCP